VGCLQKLLKAFKLKQDQSEYRNIVKATSILGGVQVFQILIQIIRSKAVALFLGPAGMGVVGLLTSTIGLITSLTNFGLGTSSVKSIAEAAVKEDDKRIATAVTILQRLVWLTGILGALACIVLSKCLSWLTFGDYQYAMAFIWISVTLLFNQLNSGQLAVLQGMRKVKYLAKASLWGSIFGLLLTVPVYYYWREKGIVPVIILTALASLVVSWFFSGKIKINKIHVSKSQTIMEGKSIVRMGFLISLSGLLGLLVSYITRVFISRVGGVTEVGLYNAGFAILTTYVGMVFTAMGTDYYPRLSAVANDKQKRNETINQQAEIAVLILGPVLIGFLVFIKWVIVFLYSYQFTAIIPMINWSVLGILFKAAGWSIGFVFFARGEGRLLFWNEFIASICMLVLNITCYHYWGLLGLGISFFLAYAIYLLQVYWITRIKYEFEFSTGFQNIFVVQIVIGIGCFMVVNFCTQTQAYVIGSILLITSTLFSISQLDKRLGFKNIVSKRFDRK
jgi:O-antigen/teichoic acid export membrane protein